MSKVEKFGDVEMLIVGVDDDDKYKSNGLKTTSGKSNSDLKDIIKNMSKSLSEEINSLDDIHKPKSVELSCSLGFSQNANLWMVGAKGEQKIQITFKWEN